jgi:transcriptional regulator with XRE-family HTH domain
MARRGMPPGDRGQGGPNPVDVHVGSRVRLRRTLLGMSQEKLGEAIGLTFQQVQKYERGANRVGASRLFDLSRVLDVPVGFFFDEMPDDVAASSPAQRPGSGSRPPEQELDPMVKRETLELVRAYYKISEAGVRKRLFEMTKALAAASTNSGPKSDD